MLVNKLIQNELLSKGATPQHIWNAVKNPSESTVFDTLFFLMYNNVTRELVNKFYCIFIAADLDFSQEEIRVLFDTHKDNAYYDLGRRKYYRPRQFDIDTIYHIYTPFYCKEDECPGPDPCLAYGPPKVYITKIHPEGDIAVDNGEGAVAYFTVEINASHPEDQKQMNVVVYGASHSYDPVTKIHKLVSDGEKPYMSYTVNVYNCFAGVTEEVTWFLADSKDSIKQGVYNLCEGDPPFDEPVQLTNNFTGDAEDIEENTQHFIKTCEGEYEPIDLSNPPVPFSAIEEDPMRPGDLLLYTNPASNVCSDFNRYTIKSNYLSNTGVQSVETVLDFVGAVPQIIPYEINTLDSSPTLNPANVNNSQPVQVFPPVGDWSNQSIYNYWDYSRTYKNNVLDVSTGGRAHAFEYTIHLYDGFFTPNVLGPVWPFIMFYKPKPEFNGTCPQTLVDIPNGFYNPSPLFEKLNGSEIEVKMLSGGQISLADFLNTSHAYETSFTSTVDGDNKIQLVVPSKDKSPIQYHMKFKYGCASLDVLLTLVVEPPPNIFNPNFVNPQTEPNLLSYDPRVLNSTKDYTDKYTFEIVSDLDGVIDILDGVFTLPTNGPHTLTFRAKPLFPFFPPFEVQETLNTSRPTFNICTPSVTGNLIDKFRTEYENAPCKAEGDQYRIDAGKEPFVWSDHLAYAALRHAYYLHKNGAPPSLGPHYEDATKPYYLGVAIGDRVRRSNYVALSSGEGISGMTSFCEAYNQFKAEYTDNMDPNAAGHFGAWVKPPPSDPLYADVYIRDIGFAVVGSRTVIVYGQSKSLAGEVPEIPQYIIDDIPDASTETASYNDETFSYSACFSSPAFPNINNPIVEWKSDIDGYLGNVATISSSNTTLSPGTHVLTATYILDGVRYQDSTTVTIVPKYTLKLVDETDHLNNSGVYNVAAYLVDRNGAETPAVGKWTSTIQGVLGTSSRLTKGDGNVQIDSLTLKNSPAQVLNFSYDNAGDILNGTISIRHYNAGFTGFIANQESYQLVQGISVNWDSSPSDMGKNWVITSPSGLPPPTSYFRSIPNNDGFKGPLLPEGSTKLTLKFESRHAELAGRVFQATIEYPPLANPHTFVPYMTLRANDYWPTIVMSTGTTYGANTATFPDVNAMSWTSDIQGDLGVGWPMHTRITMSGTHIITCTYTLHTRNSRVYAGLVLTATATRVVP